MLEILVTLVIFIIASIILVRVYLNKKKSKNNSCGCGNSKCNNCLALNCPNNVDNKEDDNK